MFYRKVCRHIHGRLLTILAVITFFGVLLPKSVNAVSFDTYIWEKYAPTNLDLTSIDPQVQELRRHVDLILTKGPLAPLRLNYGDMNAEGYW